MTDTEQQDPTASDDAPVRIPNVRDTAVSGLDNELLTPQAEEAPTEGAEPEDPEDTRTESERIADQDAQDARDAMEVPEGDQDAELAWVVEGETEPARAARADKVYAKHVDASEDQASLDTLAGALTAAVHGPRGDGDPETPEGDGDTAPADDDGQDGTPGHTEGS